MIASPLGRICLKSAIAILGLLIIGTSQALAVDLVNKDNRSYKVRVVSGYGTVDRLIKPRTIIDKICSSSCRIEVVGFGAKEVTYNENVIIENKKVIKENE